MNAADRRRVSRILAAVLCGLAIPASAAQKTAWETCYFEGSGGVGTSLALIVIEPFEIDADRKNAFLHPISAFENGPGVASVVPGYARFNSATYGCDKYDTHGAAQARADQVKAWGGYSITRAVQWTPPTSVTGRAGGGKNANVRAVPKASSSAPGPGATVVQADTTARDAAERWDAQVREALAEEAQKKVDAAVRNAKADAESRAKVAEFFAARRRQGRAQ